MARKSKRNYFNEDTQNAIIKFNSLEDIDEKNKIYNKEIHPAFKKLAENLIHSFKFYYTDVDKISHLQHELEIFLLSKITKYDASRGFKAYSYFGTIGKRWLINNNNKNYKKLLDTDSIASTGGTRNQNQSEDTDDDFSPSTPNQLISEEYEFASEKNNYDNQVQFLDEFVKWFSENLYKIYPKPNDAKIADSILELFRKRQFIDNYNKKMLYIYLREMVNAKSSKITQISKNMGKIYKEKYIFFLENGYFNFS